MSQVDYTAMSYNELRRYFLKHREDKAAFQAYLARRRERSRQPCQGEVFLRHSTWHSKHQTRLVESYGDAIG